MPDRVDERLERLERLELPPALPGAGGCAAAAPMAPGLDALRRRSDTAVGGTGDDAPLRGARAGSTTAGMLSVTGAGGAFAAAPLLLLVLLLPLVWPVTVAEGELREPSAGPGERGVEESRAAGQSTGWMPWPQGLDPRAAHESVSRWVWGRQRVHAHRWGAGTFCP